jgi:hypothetical protein
MDGELRVGWGKRPQCRLYAFFQSKKKPVLEQYRLYVG